MMAAFGIAVTFVLNLSVSFYLALRLALRAQDVSPSDHLEILRNLWRNFHARPRDFFFPPAARPRVSRDPAATCPLIPHSLAFLAISSTIRAYCEICHPEGCALCSPKDLNLNSVQSCSASTS